MGIGTTHKIINLHDQGIIPKIGELKDLSKTLGFLFTVIKTQPQKYKLFCVNVFQ